MSSLEVEQIRQRTCSQVFDFYPVHAAVSVLGIPGLNTRCKGWREVLIVRDVKNVQIQKLQTLNMSQSQELRRHVGRWPDGKNPHFPSKAEPGTEGPCEAGA